MKKKIVSMLMCLAMTVGVLSGCGNASEPAESTAGSATVGSVTTNSSETTGDNKLTMFLDELNSHPSFPFCKRVSHFESDLQILYPTFHFCNDFPVFFLAFMI